MWRKFVLTLNTKRLRFLWRTILVKRMLNKAKSELRKVRMIQVHFRKIKALRV